MARGKYGALVDWVLLMCKDARMPIPGPRFCGGVVDAPAASDNVVWWSELTYATGDMQQEKVVVNHRSAQSDTDIFFDSFCGKRKKKGAT